MSFHKSGSSTGSDVLALQSGEWMGYRRSQSHRRASSAVQGIMDALPAYAAKVGEDYEAICREAASAMDSDQDFADRDLDSEVAAIAEIEVRGF